MSVRSDLSSYSAHQKPSAGDYKFSAISIDHLGWLLCDGRSVKTSDYTFLFNIVGYSFGGSGVNFNLPNPAGRVPGIVGTGDGLTTRRLGDVVGEERHTMTIPELVTHLHTGNTDISGEHIHGITDPGHNHAYTQSYNNNHENADALGITSSNNNSGVFAADTGIRITGVSVNLAGNHYHHFTSDTTGNTVPFNVMQPTLFMGNAFIYSGKVNVGALPYTQGLFGFPRIPYVVPGSNLV